MRTKILKMLLILWAFLTPLLFGMRGAMAVSTDQTTNQSSNNDNELVHKKVCNKLISIFEKNFNLKLQPRMLIDFGNHYDIWYVVPKGFEKTKFTSDSIINSVENELGTKAKRSFQIRVEQGEDFWLPINIEFLKDVLNQNEYKSINNELMMIRYSFALGKVNREAEVKELIVISIAFKPGEIR